MKRTYLGILLMIKSIVIAQESTPKSTSNSIEALESVIISATRSRRTVSSIPIPSQVISEKNIRNTNALRLNDILNEQPGIITVPDFGGGEGVQLQGMDAAYILILVDGTPLIGRVAGTLDLNRITVTNVQQIEVIKGASSGLYGSAALGGVINIVTKTPEEGVESVLDYRYGTFETQDGSIDLGYKRKKVSLYASLNRYSSEGYDLQEDDELNTVDPFVNYTASGKVTYSISDDTKVLTSGRFYRQDQDQVASATLSGESTLNEWNARVKIAHTFSDRWSGTIDGYVTEYKAEEFLKDETDVISSTSYFKQQLMLPELQLKYTPHKKHAIIGGVGWRYEALDRTSFASKPRMNSQYAYIQYDGHLLKKLNAVVGLRFDHHEVYASQWSPKVALHYQIKEQMAVKASIGYGFKAPDFRQLYFDFTNTTVGYSVLGYQVTQEKLTQLQDQELVTNITVPLSEYEASLQSENAVSMNIGFDYAPVSSLQLGINFFRNSIRDLIDTRVIANKTNGQNVFGYYNVNKVYTTGLEAKIVYTPIQEITISGGYQLLYAKDENAEKAFEQGSVFARDPQTLQTFELKSKDYFGLYNRSRHMANIKLQYHQPRWKLNTNIRATYRSKYGIADSNGNGYLDRFDHFVKGYMIWDWAINKNVFKNHTLAIGVDNIFDFTDPINISNISGRIVYGKCTLQL